jgi:hypothetical protein
LAGSEKKNDACPFWPFFGLPRRSARRIASDIFCYQGLEHAETEHRFKTVQPNGYGLLISRVNTGAERNRSSSRVGACPLYPAPNDAQSGIGLLY